MNGESARTNCSSRCGWQSMMIYVGRTFRGIDKDDNKRKTLKVYDVTIGGDVWIYRRSYGRELWSQERFLMFVELAADLTV